MCDRMDAAALWCFMVALFCPSGGPATMPGNGATAPYHTNLNTTAEKSSMRLRLSSVAEPLVTYSTIASSSEIEEPSLGFFS
ncbi:Os05g0565966 [Oryza sativa Japonica Group]|uniref:Os05g0565966 protein n=1 Tax=Oryza sativa subsp. japonica TaxID=39947 RepID=A0A0P0WQW1_ORYSJ|nr:Os05g0565966 [Oryza sativa Japonica Group]